MIKGLYETFVLPEPFTILGRVLKPFSFAHYVVLRRLHVCYVSDDAQTETMADLITAIYFCSKNKKECEDVLYSRVEVKQPDGSVDFVPKWIVEVKEWGKEWSKYEINFEEKAALFRRYFAYHTLVLPFKNKSKGSGMVCNAEWYEPIMKLLTTHCGYTQDEVWDLCYSRAMYEYQSYMEQQGELQFYSDKDFENLAKLKEYNKKKQEALNG